jgi:DNA primase
MAKISPASIKYSITAAFEAEGPLEKPDVIGALFGQTEGLLGSDMELRELQKEGKIGRIEVESTKEGGKTKGEIIIPSALDKTETTIIAAALETIDKIGPTDAKITILEIEDVRGNKRDYIMDRAKQLLAGIKGAEVESQEMGQELRESSRVEKISSYGEEDLPAGDLSGNEIIVVEGRADVVNMLKHRINNVIGMQGTRFPKSITKLSEEKEITLFVDGDRGGKLIAQNVCDNAKVAYIAQAPDGKEVEELAGKELHMALRKKVKPEEFFRKFDAPRFERTERRDSYSRQDSYSRRHDSYSRDEEVSVKAKSEKKISSSEKEKLKDLMSEIRGKNVLILGEDLQILRNVPASKVEFLRIEEPVWVLMASETSRALFAGAKKLGAKYIAAESFGRIEDSSIELISL